jgi:hypothetical protein
VIRLQHEFGGTGSMAGVPLLEQAIHRARAEPGRAAALLSDCLPLQATRVDLLPRRQVVANEVQSQGKLQADFQSTCLPWILIVPDPL